MLHSAGKLGRICLLKTAKPHGSDDRFNLLLILVLFFQTEGDIVPHIQPWHKPRLLEHECGLMGQSIPYFPFIHLFQTACQAQERGLAASAASQDYRDMLLRYLKADSLQDLDRPFIHHILFVYVNKLNSSHCHRILSIIC